MRLAGAAIAGVRPNPDSEPSFSPILIFGGDGQLIVGYFEDGCPAKDCGLLLVSHQVSY